jgi:hypothetical protein
MPQGAWTKKCPNVAHLQEFRAPMWILHEQLNISKLKPKSVRQIFVGFENRPKVIKYYDSAIHYVKISCNYTFYSADTPIQLEEEKKSKSIDTESLTKKRKRPDEDGGHLFPRQSTRPRVEHNYASLHDPFQTFNSAPELVALACDPEEGHPVMSSDKIINATLNVANLTFEDPQTLSEARKSPEWPKWEKAILSELDQL